MTDTSKPLVPLLTTLLLLVLVPGTVGAQERRGPPARPRPQAVMVGARVGVDYFNDAFVMGAQSHLILDPWGVVDLMPNAEVAFFRGTRDWQLNADVAILPVRGFYGGGGAAFRNSVYDFEVGERETRTGYSFFLGLLVPPGRRSIATQVELRWSFIDDKEPRSVTIGANWPLLLW